MNIAAPTASRLSQSSRRPVGYASTRRAKSAHGRSCVMAPSAKRTGLSDSGSTGRNHENPTSTMIGPTPLPGRRSQVIRPAATKRSAVAIPSAPRTVK